MMVEIVNRTRSQVLVAGVYLAGMASVDLDDDNFASWVEDNEGHAKWVIDNFLTLTPPLEDIFPRRKKAKSAEAKAKAKAKAKSDAEATKAAEAKAKAEAEAEAKEKADQGGGEGDGDAETATVPAHIRQIAELIPGLPPKALTAAGKPKTDVLSALLGAPVSADERDEALAYIESAKTTTDN